MTRVWSSHPYIVDSLVIAFFAIFLIADRSLANVNVADFVPGERVVVYRTAATVGATIMGFSIAAVSIVFGLSSNERLQLLSASSEYPRLWNALFHTIRLTGLLIVAAFVGMVIDDDDAPNLYVVLPFAAIAVLAMIRLYLIIWIVEQLVRVVLAHYRQMVKSGMTATNGDKAASKW